MKNVALIVAVAASTLASFYVGTAYTQRTSQYQTNLCLTDRALVTSYVDGLRQWTPKLVKQFGRGTYERARRKTFYYGLRFQQAAPCEIQFKLPPDFTKGG